VSLISKTWGCGNRLRSHKQWKARGWIGDSESFFSSAVFTSTALKGGGVCVIAGLWWGRQQILILVCRNLMQEKC
jgi:hypothetical protein